MNGMRTKGTELNTDFGNIKASKESTHLSRIQEGMFDTASQEKTAIYYVVDNGEEREANLDDFKYWSEEFGRTFLGMRGEEVSKEDALANIEQTTAVYNPQGILIARNDQYDIVKGMVEKTAIFFDGYDIRVTVESRAGNNNGNYSEVLSALSDSDIRYQEVRRYTIQPDRVMLDILICKEDADIVKGLSDELKEADITFTVNDNVSEGTQPKVITTPEKEVEEKLPKAE